MTASERLYELLGELSSDKKTAEFEYEAIFEKDQGRVELKSNFVLYYQSQKLFIAEKSEIVNLQPEDVPSWMTRKAMGTMSTDVFLLKSLEDDIKKLQFDRRLKEERRQRNLSSAFYSKSLEKQVGKELKIIVKKIEEKERRIAELIKYKPTAKAAVLLRAKEKEVTEVTS